MQSLEVDLLGQGGRGRAWIGVGEAGDRYERGGQGELWVQICLLQNFPALCCWEMQVGRRG